MAAGEGAAGSVAGGGDGASNANQPQRGNRRGGAGGSGGGTSGEGSNTQSGRGGGRGRSGRGRGGGEGRGAGRGRGNRGGDHGGDRSSDTRYGNNGGQRRRGGGGGRGGREGGHQDRVAEGEAKTTSQKDPILRSTRTQDDGAAGGADEGTDGDAEVCFICANPVIHHAIAPCNHLTCHICALRMRALYRNKDCPHCRTPAPYVIFTDDPAKRFDEYTDADITSTDDTIGIKYTNEDIVGDTVLLLRYNCPDEACDYAGFSWPDLHRHVRTVHHKKMCDLCTRNKKVFTHEHELFTDKALERHMRHGDDRPGAVDQTGFRGHPLCSFCGERFYDDDKLYEHCRNKHERCFICDRRDARSPHYYRNYDELEKHFRKDHYLCYDRECLEKKFVVFESELDLKAHQLSEHGSTLSKDVRRDVQVVSMADFDVRPSGRGGGGGGPSRQGRGRDPNADLPPAVSSSQNLRRDEIAYQRQLAIHSAQSISNRTFGSQLTAPDPTPAQASSSQASRQQNGGSRRNNSGGSSNPAPQGASASATGGPSALVDPMQALGVQELSKLSPQDRARLVRHGAVIERASNLLGSNPAKVTAFRSHISSFRVGTSTAAQLIDAFSTLFADTSDTALGSLVREVADLFDDPVKADALRRALNDRRAVHEDYPSLPTLGGMHGATTASSGWAAAASSSPAAATSVNASSAQRQSSTRVLRLKHSTRLGGPSGGSSTSASATPSTTGPSGRAVPGATWTAPSRPSTLSAMPGAVRSQSTASSAFPALPSVGSKASAASSSSLWAGSSGGGPSSSLAARVGGGSLSVTPAAASNTSRRAIGEDNFPALPAAPKPPPPSVFGYGRKAVRRDFGTGGNQDTGFSWGGGGASGSSGAANDAADGESAEDDAGKGKKKGRQGKKVLVQWG